MEVLAGSFVLGLASAASPCLLPLYPALLAMLAGRSSVSSVAGVTGAPSTPRGAALYGLVVVLGVITAMVIVGLVVTALAVSLSSVLELVVPFTTIVLVLLGLTMIAGINPFARLASIEVPVVRHPLAQAYIYGLAFGPVALPCAGPFVIALLVISVGLADTAVRLAGFVAFGIGLGLPLLALSLVDGLRGRRLAGWLARRHRLVTRVAGVALVAVAFAEPLRLLLAGESVWPL